MESSTRPVPPSRAVTLVVGPGLSGAEAEVGQLRHLHRRVESLEGDQATAERAMSALDGVWLAHIAAHGTFRSDSPLFSSLNLRDGPLTVYDLDRLRRPPYRIILSACDVGGGEAVGSDELLGLVSSLLGLGSTGVLAAAVAVNDRAAVPMMTRIHAELAAGASLAESWLAARVEATEPLAVATAASFTAWGV
jgi:CHAT domain-containing protein